MLHEDRKALSKLRLDNAKMLLKSAQAMIDLEDYKSAANRSYYAIFNAMRAELAILGIDHKKHKGIISDFRIHFIKLEKHLTDILIT